VTSVYPAVGPSAGNSRVVVRGTGFQDTPETFCRFGDLVAVAPLAVPDATTIICRSPPRGQSPASVVVAVTNNNFEYTADRVLFTYIPDLQATLVEPGHGPLNGSTLVVVRGSGFVNTSALACRFGGSGGGPAIFRSEEEIACVSPPSDQSQSVSLAITANGVDYVQTGFQFVYTKPLQLTSVSPVLGSEDGGTAVTLTGGDFLLFREELVCEFGSQQYRVSAEWMGRTTVVCRAPMHPPGEVVVRLSNNGQQFVSATDAKGSPLTYTFHERLSVLEVYPSRGTLVGGTSIVVHGKGFLNSTSLACQFGDRISPAVHLNGSAIECRTPGSPAAGVVVVEASNNGVDFSSGGAPFTYTGKVQVQDVIPRSGPAAGGTLVKLVGSGFLGGGVLVCKFGQRVATAVVESDTELSCVAPEGAPGTTPLSLGLAGAGQGFPVTAFLYYENLVITDIKPRFGGEDRGRTVTITGSNFFKSDSWVCRFGGLPPVSAKWTSTSAITCPTPPHPPGRVQVAISANGVDYLPAMLGFHYRPAFTLTSLSPAGGPISGGPVVRILGTGFVDEVYECFFGDTPVPATFLSPVELECTAPPHVPGPVNVTVASPAEDLDEVEAAYRLRFEYQDAAYIESVSPMAGPANGGTAVEVRGWGFSATEGLQCVFDGQGGRVLTNATRLSDSIVRCVTPLYPSAPCTVSLDLEASGYTATRGGVQFTFHPELEIESLLPATGPESGGTRVKVFGRNFLPFDLLSCRFGAAGLAPARWLSSETLECISPPALDTSAVVTVSNNGVDFSDSSTTFDYLPIVTVGPISPAVGSSLGGTLVTVQGNNFLNSSLLSCSFGSAVVPAAFVSASTAVCVAPPRSRRSGSSVTVSVSVNAVDFVQSPVPFVYQEPPVVDSIYPAAGAPGGGTLVHIIGQYLSPPAPYSAYCRFGPSFTVPAFVESPRSLRCISPSTQDVNGSTSVALSVSTNGGTDYFSSGTRFAFKDLVQLYSLNPAVDVDLGGANVTILGSGFRPTAQLACRFGTEIVPARYLTSRSIACTAPAYVPGPVKVTVTLDGVDFSIGELRFVFLPRLKLQDVSPAAIPVGAAAALTVTGSGFDAAALGGLNIFCRLNGTRSEAAVLSSGSLRCRLPHLPTAGPLGLRLCSSTSDLSPDDLSVWVYEPPQLLGLSPGFGPPSGGTVLQLEGTGFNVSQGMFCAFRSVDGPALFSPATVMSDGKAACPTPAIDSDYGKLVTVSLALDKVFINGNGLSFWFVPLPKLATAVPSLGSTAGGTPVIITAVEGSTFLRAGVTACRFGGVLTHAEVLAPDQLMCLTPPGIQRSVTLEVTENGQDFTSSGLNFTYVTPPEILSLSPDAGVSEGGTVVRVLGTGFQAGSSLAQCRFGDIAVPATVISPEEAECVTPAVDGAGEMPVSFSVNRVEFVESELVFGFYSQPKIASIWPESATVNETTTVTLQVDSLPAGRTVTCKQGTGPAVAAVIADGDIMCDIVCERAGRTTSSVSLNGVDYGPQSQHVFYCDPLPVLTGISPAFGTALGASQVILTGSGFVDRPGLSCKFGSSEPVDATFISASTIACASPAMMVGTVPVSVSSNGYHYSLPTSFAYIAAEAVLGVVPDVVDRRGGQVVVVTGANFRDSSSLGCRIGGVTAPAEFVSASEVRCVVPSSLPIGPALVTLANNGEDYDSVPGVEIEVEATPLVEAVMPPRALKQGGAIINVYGSGFVQRSGIALCRFGSDPPTTAPALYISSTQIQCIMPDLSGAAAGSLTVDVTIDGDYYTDSGIVLRLVESLAVSRVIPSSGPTMGGTIVRVSGLGFSSSERYQCRFGTEPPRPAVSVSPAVVTCIAPDVSAIGSVDVSLLLDDSEIAWAPKAFTYYAQPTITAISPASGSVYGGSLIGVSGTGLGSGEDGLWCRFGATVVPAIPVSETLLQCRSPPQAPDGALVVPLSVSGNGADYSEPIDFTYSKVWTVSGLAPRSGPASGGTVVTISGSDFNPYGDLRCRFGEDERGVAVAFFQSATEIVCTAPGASDASVVGLAGHFYLSFDGGEFVDTLASFTYEVEPVVSGVEPARVPQTGNTVVALSGAGFRDRPELTCRFGVTAPVKALWVSESLIECLAPPMAPGQVSLRVSLNGQDFVSPPVTLEYFAVTTITSVVPVTGPTSGGTSVRILGAGIEAGPEGKVLCLFGGVAALATVVSSTEVTCSNPPRLGMRQGWVGVSLSLGARVAQFESPTGFYYFDPPAVTSLTPTLGPLTGGTLVELELAKGLPDFLSASSGLDLRPSCRFDGVVAVATVGLSGQTLTCEAPGAVSVGPVDVAISLNGVDFTVIEPLFTYYAPPRIDTMQPATIPTAGDVPITITGENFLRTHDLACRFGRTVRPALWLSESVVKCVAPGHDGPAYSQLFISVDGVTWFLAPGFIAYQDVNSLSGLMPSIVSDRGGSLMTLVGTGFVNASSLEVVLSTTDGSEYARVPGSFVDPHTLTFFTPYLAGAPGTVSVGVLLNGRNFSDTSLPLPFVPGLQLASVSPHMGPSTGGTVLRLRGANLGGPMAHSCRISGHYPNGSAAVARVPAEPAGMDGDALDCTTPPSPLCDGDGSGCEGPVLLRVSRPDGLVSDDAVRFWYVKPMRLRDVMPRWVPEEGQVNVTVMGDHLEDVTGSFMCRVGGSDPVPARHVNASAVEFVVPPGQPGTAEVQVTQNGADWAGGVFLTYETALSLLALEPEAGPMSGGTDVTISGKGFRHVALGQAHEDVNLIPFCRFGNLEVMATIAGDASVHCTAPTVHEVGAVNVSIVLRYPFTKKKIEFHGPLLRFRYQLRPTVTALDPKSGSTRGGTVLTITGTNFEDSGKSRASFSFIGRAAHADASCREQGCCVCGSVRATCRRRSSHSSSHPQAFSRPSRPAPVRVHAEVQWPWR
jgi:hypothetical protein